MDTVTRYHKELILNTKKIEQLATTNFDSYSAIAIVDFLEKSHQQFFNQSIPKIEQSFSSLVKVFPEVKQLTALFNLFIKFQIDLKQHTQIEEKTFFPYATTLYKASISNSMPALLLIHFSKYSAQDFANSHKNTECFLTEIIHYLEQQEELKQHLGFNILLKQLHQLDSELKTHTWIEDNVLVKKVIEIELAISGFVKTIEN